MNCTSRLSARATPGTPRTRSTVVSGKLWAKSTLGVSREVTQMSALAFSIGALLPLAAVMLAPPARVETLTIATTLVGLALSGGLAAWAGGAPVLRGAWRVVFWGALAMLAAAAVGRLFGADVAA